MTVRGTVAISACALAFVGALGAMPVARRRRQAVSLPVVRFDKFTIHSSDSTLLAELDLGFTSLRLLLRARRLRSGRAR
jgi:hypothetical protein